eukprot:6195811-Pleurochrysis_carterae.AAC.2
MLWHARAHGPSSPASRTRCCLSAVVTSQVSFDGKKLKFVPTPPRTTMPTSSTTAAQPSMRAAGPSRARRTVSHAQPTKSSTQTDEI